MKLTLPVTRRRAQLLARLASYQTPDARYANLLRKLRGTVSSQPTLVQVKNAAA